ncbi:MDR family MFS transporter [Bacillus sp. B1-b2]|uniref:MDR family MFS transporter n=1 Tax=Bacillus sp. B1-b2 TaxID=2653201 RepID=UPI0012613F9C|nr:MFS transporter [Bacillus sp. B1-b2]KAB7666801.1 MFS transporter [Bacillus sp. B1-b2]
MPRSLWLLVIGMAVNVTGSSLLWPLNSIYIHEHLGKSLTVAGFILMLNSLASVIGNLFGGTLYDKIGGYYSILIGISFTVFSLLGLTLFHTWTAYCLFFVLSGFGSGIIYPSMYAMAGNVWPEGGRKAFNSIYVAQNVGVALGSAIGGVIASYSFQLIFLSNTIMYIMFFIIAFLFYKGIQVKAAPAIKENVLATKNKLSSKRNPAMYSLSILGIGYLLCWICYVQWQATISTHTQELGIPLTQYSILWAVNGGLIVFGQPLVSLFTKKICTSIKKQMVIGIFIFILSFLLLGKAEIFTGFLVAMIILTIGEMLVWPAVPTIADKLAPKGREGFFQGIVNSTATGGRMIGPLLGGMLVDYKGIDFLIPILIVLLIISLLAAYFYDYPAKALSKVPPKVKA